MQGFFFRLLAGAAGLWIAAEIVPGIHITETSTFFLAAILLGIVNAIIRPIVIILTLPISVISLGVFLLVINAGMLGIVAWLVDDFRLGGFFPALLGSLTISIVSWLTAISIGSKGDIELMMARKPK